jgi:streptogramin lyase
MSITVTPIGGSPTTFGPSPCTTISCTVSFTTVPGITKITFTLTDNSANALSIFSTTISVPPSTFNTLNFTANPVVNSVALQLASATVNAGNPADDLLTLQARDIDGNIIIGNGKYLDANGNPVTFTLNTSNIQAGGMGSVNIQGSSIIFASEQNVGYAHYDGKWLASSTISVNSSSNAVPILTSITVTTTPTVVHEFAVGSAPTYLVTGSDGNLWFAESTGNKIGKVTNSGILTEYSPPTGASKPYGITTGPDGNIWFTEYNGNKIGKVTTSGTFTEYSVPTPASQPYEITTGPDGNLWFTEYIGDKIGKVTTSGTFTEYSIPTGAPQPNGITTGPDGNLWFVESSSNKIGKVTTSGTFTEYSIPTAASQPLAITSGPDGNLWFSELSGNNIGKVTTSGVFTEYSVPTAASKPLGIATGPDGNLWFTEFNSTKIGKVTTSGAFAEYGIPTAVSKPIGITIGPDGNLWFSESAGNNIGSFVY